MSVFYGVDKEFEGAHGSKRHASRDGDDATGPSQDKRLRAFDFSSVWDAYEQQTEHERLSDMPELRGMSKQAFREHVFATMTERTVGAFTVKLYVEDGWEYSEGLRPYPVEVGLEWFREHVVEPWNATPSPNFPVWDSACTKQSAVRSPVSLDEKCLEDRRCIFVAYSSASAEIAGVAQYKVEDAELWVDALTSKARGAGHAIMVTMEAVAGAWGLKLLCLSSLNWISASTEEACQTLPEGEYKSLNEFYKRHGLRDTWDACQPHWVDRVTGPGVIEPPIQRSPAGMSKCLAPPKHVDRLAWSPSTAVLRR